MRILSMTATFGKLEHDTLTLQPGLNVIHAPNEWGKSTWCAFLLAMLYGLDTRAKSTRTSLADKEHFAPWSGKPMSGRMEILWQGREITIERTTRGRIPMGIFRAYETKTGLDVPELTAANCGQLLLGVESSVFRRAGFIRQSDLPVTQDDSLRRRLNALVTTGDESGDGAQLERDLRELKNRCRHNRTGLLPQAEQERDALRRTLEEVISLETQQERAKANLEAAMQLQQKLENHAAHLAYQASRMQAANIENAAAAKAEADRRLEDVQNTCAALPSREDAEERLRELGRHQQSLRELRQDQQNMPLPPQRPRVPRPFVGLEPDAAMEQVQEDMQTLRRCSGPLWWLLLMAAVLAFAAGGLLLWQQLVLPAALGFAFGAVLAVFALLRRMGQRKGAAALRRKYGSSNPEDWVQIAKIYASDCWRCRRAEQDYLNSREELGIRHEELMHRHAALCGSRTVEEAMQECRNVCAAWEDLSRARREAGQCARQLSALQMMTQPAACPAQPDTLNLSREETQHQMQEVLAEQHRLENLLGEYRGRMESIGRKDALEKQLDAVEQRILSLEKTYAAITIAQDTLARATAELQRRYAPRIACRAQELMRRMTHGRYDRLMLTAELALQAGAAQEDTLCDAAWRSEGTVDQLYIALRLAVAEELTPEAPLVLDDALVRFDEKRMKATLKILQELSGQKQVILFTCQQREQAALEP